MDASAGLSNIESVSQTLRQLYLRFLVKLRRSVISIDTRTASAWPSDVIAREFHYLAELGESLRAWIRDRRVRGLGPAAGGLRRGAP